MKKNIKAARLDKAGGRSPLVQYQMGHGDWKKATGTITISSEGAAVDISCLILEDLRDFNLLIATLRKSWKHLSHFRSAQEERKNLDKLKMIPEEEVSRLVTAEPLPVIPSYSGIRGN
jgi:hypothetical protein